MTARKRGGRTASTGAAALALNAQDVAEARAAEIEAWAARTAAAGDRFDEATAAKACAFFPKYLRHTEAEWAGRPFVLDPWERAAVRATFGWKRADGYRRFRVVYIEIPKKNGKTEFAAGLMLLMLLGDGEVSGQVYSLAVDKDQARIVFNKASYMVALAPDDFRKRLDVFKTSIYAPELNATIKPLSSVPIGKHGFSVSGSVKDELHEWQSDELADAVHKGTAARRQPLEVEITTAGQKGRGYGWQRHEHALKVLAGEVEDHGFLPVVFAADPEDDWTSPAVWAKVNPGLGKSPKLDFIRAECAAAEGNPRRENDFKRFHLNLWVEQVTRWIPLGDWDRNTEDPADPLLWKALEARMKGRPCWGGLDLGATNDPVGLAWCFPPEAEGGRWTFLYRCWLPEENAPAFVKRTRVPWETWKAAGAVILTEGNISDYRAIRTQIERDSETFRVQELAIDRWNSSQLVTELQEDGAPVSWFGQGFKSMTGPAHEFDRIVFAKPGLVEHGNHPVARWMIGNVAIKTDEAGCIKPDKKRSGEKIDLVVTMIMALGRALKREGKGENLATALERRGMVTV